MSSSKIGNVVFGLISRRMYARAVDAQASSASAGAVAATAKTDVAAASDAARAAKKKPDKFWMRDPKTGCWVPEKENRFEEVDAVDLRSRMIRHK